MKDEELHKYRTRDAMIRPMSRLLRPQTHPLVFIALAGALAQSFGCGGDPATLRADGYYIAESLKSGPLARLGPPSMTTVFVVAQVSIRSEALTQAENKRALDFSAKRFTLILANGEPVQAWAVAPEGTRQPVYYVFGGEVTNYYLKDPPEWVWAQVVWTIPGKERKPPLRVRFDDEEPVELPPAGNHVIRRD